MLMHTFYIQNNDLLPVNQYEANTGIEIYEVIRIMEGVPLFLEDHLKRFYHSAWLLHLLIPLTEEEIRSSLELLAESNGIKEGNIRFSYCFRPCGKFQAYFIPHSYPLPAMVTEGVNCGLMYASRNDPNVKAVQSGLRLSADQLIASEGFYEVLLVNDNAAITEGSRSNVFFVKENTLITAPDEDILPGITRKKVIEIASGSGIPIHFEPLQKDNLNWIDAVFLTGTSPKVLPVNRVGDLHFTTDNPLVQKMIEGYNDLIDNYISHV
jgi:branched-chain amino acid aminotransferase